MANSGASCSSSSSSLTSRVTVKPISLQKPTSADKYTVKLSYTTWRSTLISPSIFSRYGPASFISSPLIGHTGIIFHVHLRPDNTSVFLSLDGRSVIPKGFNLNATFRFTIESDVDLYGTHKCFIPKRSREMTGVFSLSSGSRATGNTHASLFGWQNAYERRALGNDTHFVAHGQPPRVEPNFQYKKHVSFEVEHWFTPCQPIQHHRHFQDSLRPLSGQFTDVTLVLSDGTLLQAHKLILSAQSAVFRSMFSNDAYVESQTSRVSIMEDISTQTMRRLLKYIYSCDKSVVQEGDLIELLKAAHAYEITPLINEIIATLMNRTTVDNCCQYLYYADLFSFDTLKGSLLDFICENEGAISIQEGVKWLGPQLMHLYSERVRERAAIEAQVKAKNANDEKGQTLGQVSPKYCSCNCSCNCSSDE